MAVVPYDYIDQDIVATAVIQPHDIDSFYNPVVQGHTGFAGDGTHYTAGVQDQPLNYASWFVEGTGPYRGTKTSFPNLGLILLSKVAVTIIDQANRQLTLWMQFLLADAFAMTNDFNASSSGFAPSSMTYADGVLSIVYTPDEGSIDIKSHMVVTFDFTQDKVFADVAVPMP